MKYLNNNLKNNLLNCFKNSKKRIIILDYDGTLIPFDIKILTPPKELLELLKKLTKVKNTEVLIISGRGKDKLDRWFGKLDVSLIAEHGVWFKKTNKGWQKILKINNQWKKTILEILNNLQEKFKFVWVEKKDYSTAVVLTKNNSKLKAKVFNYLKSHIDRKNLSVTKGNKNIVEIRPKLANKGYALEKWFSKYKYDFVLAFGDDVGDEEMFKVLKKKKDIYTFTIKVGYDKTKASYFLRNYKEVRSLLKKVANLS